MIFTHICLFGIREIFPPTPPLPPYSMQKTGSGLSGWGSFDLCMAALIAQYLNAELSSLSTWEPVATCIELIGVTSTFISLRWLLVRFQSRYWRCRFSMVRYSRISRRSQLFHIGHNRNTNIPVTHRTLKPSGLKSAIPKSEPPSRYCSISISILWTVYI